MKQLWARWSRFLDKGGLLLCACLCAGAIISAYLLAQSSPAKPPAASAAVQSDESFLGLPSVQTILLPLPTPTPSREIVPPVDGTVITPFDSALAFYPSVSAYLPHEAVDLAAPLGAAVVAIKAGKVESTGVDTVDGTFVWILHDDGDRVLYANLLDEPLVRAGDPVRADDTIGFVGRSMPSEKDLPPHAHIMAIRHGQPIDPSILW